MTNATPRPTPRSRARATSPAAPTPLNPAPVSAADEAPVSRGMANLPTDYHAPAPVSVAAQQAAIAAQIHAAATRFEDSEAATAKLIEDPETIKARDLVGCDIHIVGFDMVMNTFDPQRPKWQAVCTITIDQRPELLMRKVYLSSKLAMAQLKSVPTSQFPLWVSLKFDDPRKGQWASIILAAPLEDQQWEYIHPTDDAWDEYQAAETPSWRATAF